MASLHRHLREVKGPKSFLSIHHLAQRICTVDEMVARALPLWDLRLPICKWVGTETKSGLRHNCPYSSGIRMTFIPGILLPPFLEDHYKSKPKRR